MVSNIILIGMPGAGKSTIGVVLAKKLGFSFVDTDLVIQEKQKMLLHEILEEYGQEGFNEVENDILYDIFAKNARTFLSYSSENGMIGKTGGGDSCRMPEERRQSIARYALRYGKQSCL